MTSSPSSHQTDAAFEPMARRTSGRSRGAWTTVTTQKSTFDVGLFLAYAKWNRFTLYPRVSTACQATASSPAVAVWPSRGTTLEGPTANFFTAACTALSVSWFDTRIGSSTSQR